MVDVVCHERFYETGASSCEALGVYLGWVVRRGSSDAGMMFRGESSDVSMFFSGEEYSQREIQRTTAHGDEGPVSRGSSLLVRAYREDPRFPAGLNGLFHGLVCDQVRGTATLFNDRWGMHRIYYHESSSAFYFASEAKAILAVRPELRSLEARSLGELIACGCVLEGRTLFRGIDVLPPASSWVFRNGRIAAKEQYFRPDEWEGQTPLDRESFYGELRDTFSRNLPRYFDGGDAIGMSLTGGLDTRMIMAWDKSPPGALPCYSFGGTARDCHDVRLARRVASLRRQPHQVITVGKEFLSNFAHYAGRSIYLSDGCTGVDRAPDLYVNEQARTIAAVRLTGNYGGEVLRRVRAFRPVDPLKGLYSEDLIRDVRGAFVTYARVSACHPLSFAVFRQAPWHHYGVLALEQTQLAVRSPFLDNDLVRTLFRAPESACMSDDISVRLIAEGDPRLLWIPTDRGIGGNHGRLFSAASRRLRGFTFKAEYAYDSGMPQWLARVDHLMSPLRIERLFLGRHKFTHFRPWYRDILAGYVRDILLDPRALARPYLNRRAVEFVVARHLNGTGNYTDAIHQLLTLELLHRLFVDSAPRTVTA